MIDAGDLFGHQDRESADSRERRYTALDHQAFVDRRREHTDLVDYRTEAQREWVAMIYDCAFPLQAGIYRLADCPEP